ncbi:MAG: hypothetical protein ABI461_03495 [Polyangiaceae bacterium]
MATFEDLLPAVVSVWGEACCDDGCDDRFDDGPSDGLDFLDFDRFVFFAICISGEPVFQVRG